MLWRQGKAAFCAGKGESECQFLRQGTAAKLIEDYNRLLLNGYVFQQDSAPAHFSHLAQEWIGQHCPEFIKKDEWLQNSLDLNPLNHQWVNASEAQGIHAQVDNKAELKTVLEAIWKDLLQDISTKLCWRCGRGYRRAFVQKVATLSTFSNR